MRLLDTEARALGTEIDGEMKRLSEKAAGTVWTGSNREKHDAVVAALDDDIVAIRTAIDELRHRGVERRQRRADDDDDHDAGQGRGGRWQGPRGRGVLRHVGDRPAQRVRPSDERLRRRR